MPPLSQLSCDLHEQFPSAVIDIRRADDPQGVQFLHFDLDGFEVGVEWKSDHGFGITSFDQASFNTEGLFDAPSEWYDSEQAAFHRVASLVLDQRSTRSKPAKLAEL